MTKTLWRVSGVLLALSIVHCPLSIIRAQERGYTLQECLEAGLERNYSVRIARGEQQIAENDATWGNAGFLPTVGVDAGWSVASESSREDGAMATSGVATQTLNAGVDAVWTLSEGFSVLTNWKRLRELEQMGRLAARITIEDFVASLTAEYYNFIQQTIRLDNYGYAVGLSRERLRIAEARYLLGNGSRPEVLQAQVDYNADSSLLILQKERIAASRVTLNELMAARDVDREFWASDTVIVIDERLDLGTLHERMINQSSELAHAERSGTLAGLDLKMVRSRAYPALRLNAGYGYATNRFSRGETRRREGWGPDLGLSMGFTIFDGNRGREIRNARITADNARLRTRETETALEADLTTFWLAYQNNRQLLALEGENLVSARQNYEAARELYMQGVMAGIELREAQKSLLDAQERILVAQYNTKICEISLYQVSGQALLYVAR